MTVRDLTKWSPGNQLTTHLTHIIITYTLSERSLQLNRPLRINSQRPLLDHHRKNLIKHIRSSPSHNSLANLSKRKTTKQLFASKKKEKKEVGIHSRQLGISIISRCNLDDIGPDEIQPIQTTDDRAQFAGRPAACFGGAGCGCICKFLISPISHCVGFRMVCFIWKKGHR